MNDLELTQITDAREAPIVIHGTSKKAWETIQSEVHLLGTFFTSETQAVSLHVSYAKMLIATLQLNWTIQINVFNKMKDILIINTFK